ATPPTSTLSLHDALPISQLPVRHQQTHRPPGVRQERAVGDLLPRALDVAAVFSGRRDERVPFAPGTQRHPRVLRPREPGQVLDRSEEHTSELPSLTNLVS